ncbi:hypothetical protein [Terricaulis sp.]|uniref:hypothetical protein n=1 Tax=Terricaulis sp. TaxID=2768686 RepID=UPI0037834815
MAIFPKIQSPCPYKGKLSDIMDGDTCRLCKRDVVDLNGFSDAERVAFLKACGDTEVCVTYKFPVRAAAAAVLAAAALGAPMQAAAQDNTELEEDYIIVGGITDPANTVFISDKEDASVPELPVVYDEVTDDDATKTDAASTSTDFNHSVETQ